MKSFKTRVIVWTLSISALVLIAFGLALDRVYFGLKLAGVDEGLRSIATPVFHPPDQDRFWIPFSERAKELGLHNLQAEPIIFVYPEIHSQARLIGDRADVAMLDLLPMVERHRQTRESSEDVDEPSELDFLPPPDPPGPRLRDGRGPGRGVGRNSLGPVENVSVDSRGVTWRFAVYKLRGFNVAIGVSLADTLTDLRRLRLAFFLALPIALLVLGIGAWFFARKAIEPITKLTAVADSITASDLSVRIQKSNEDEEFAALIGVFNGMLERLDRSFEQARRFSADAAHELKTPLAILQGHLERAVQNVPPDSEMQITLGELIEETHRLKSITRKLLTLAQADTGRLPIILEKVEMSAAVDEALDSVSDKAEDSTFVWLRREKVDLQCDRRLLAQILQNLISNASKYRTPQGSPVELSLYAEADKGIFRIGNACEPLSPTERLALFDRFTRASTSRNREVDGTGLGLSLAREFASAHGGSLTILDSTDPGRIAFELTLPTGFA